MTEAVRLAIEKVGFADLTKAAIRAALFSIKDFDTGLVPPITISEGKPYFLDLRELLRCGRAGL